MIYESIMKKYNISTLLILPLLNDICKNLKDDFNNQHNIFTVFFNSGLIKAYLFKENEEITESYSLKLLFKKSITIKPFNNVNKHWNLLTFLVFNNLILNYKILKQDKILLEIPINKVYNKDIIHIINSDYSKVSELYKKTISMKGVNVRPEDQEHYFMLVNNLPLAVVNKSNKLINYILEIYKADIPPDEIKELLPLFNIENETYKNN